MSRSPIQGAADEAVLSEEDVSAGSTVPLGPIRCRLRKADHADVLDTRTRRAHGERTLLLPSPAEAKGQSIASPIEQTEQSPGSDRA